MSKAVADKCDVGMITTWIGQEESQIMEPIVSKLGYPMPNYVTDIYKARRSKYKNVKIWSRVDLGTCRVEDICITDGYYNPIPDFEVLKYSYNNKDNNENKIELQENKESFKEDIKPEKKLSLEDF